MRENLRLNYEIEEFIDTWDGTIIAEEVKNMYENGTSYEQICEKMDIDFKDFKEL